MAIPSVLLSTDSTLKTYAENTNSVLEITSMLFTGHSVKFLAFLTDMSQNFDSTWNSEQVFGRNDPIAIFQGTTRTISLGFNVVAGNLKEAVENLKKIDVLASFMYPSYRDNGTISKEEGLTVQQTVTSKHMYGAPLIKVKFANLINGNLAGSDGLLGYVSALSIVPNLDNGSFISNQNHFPKSFDISFSLNVLHQRTPGWNADALDGEWNGDAHFFGTGKAPGNTGTLEEQGDAFHQDLLDSNDPFGMDEIYDPNAEPTEPQPTYDMMADVREEERRTGDIMTTLIEQGDEDIFGNF